MEKRGGQREYNGPTLVGERNDSLLRYRLVVNSVQDGLVEFVVVLKQQKTFSKRRVFISQTLNAKNAVRCLIDGDESAVSVDHHDAVLHVSQHTTGEEIVLRHGSWRRFNSR